MPRNKHQSEQMRIESRNKILATAQKLFAERGYGECTVSDIAKKAGMSQGNIYWYFPSKEEILKAVLAEGFNTLGSAMAGAAEYPGTGKEKLDRFIESFTALMQTKEGEEFITIIMILIAHGGTARFSELGLSTHEIGESYHRSRNAILVQCQSEGTIVKGADPDLMSTFFFSFMNGLILMYPEDWRNIRTEELHNALMRLLGIEGNMK